MKLRSSRLSFPIAVSICILSGCASVPQSGSAGGATEIKIYGSDQLAGTRYEVVSHLGMDSWRSDFWLPTYPSESDAIAAMRAEAVRLGADGLTNVICLDQGHPKWSSSTEPAVLCYGNAIRVMKDAG